MSGSGPSPSSSPAGYEIPLPGGSVGTLLAGESLGLVGEPARAIVDGFGAEHGAALLVPDTADPLHAGYGVADQIAAALGGAHRAAVDRATDLLELAGVPEPHRRARARPHELSPLDRQRVQLALALANAPDLIVGDDPTAGLNVTDAAAFATGLRRLGQRLGFSLLIAARQLEAAQRMVDEIIELDADGVVARRRGRARPAPASPI